MRAGFKRDIGGRTPSGRTSLRQCFGFGMRTTTGLRPALAHHQVALNDDASHRRVGPCMTHPSAAQLQRPAHVVHIIRAHEGRSLFGFCFVFFVRSQFADEFVEIVGFLEVLVDAGKPDIGNRIDPGQRFHHDLADLL